MGSTLGLSRLWGARAPSFNCTGTGRYLGKGRLNPASELPEYQVGTASCSSSLRPDLKGDSNMQ